MDINPAGEKNLLKIKEGFEGQIACILPQHKENFALPIRFAKNFI